MYQIIQSNLFLSNLKITLIYPRIQDTEVKFSLETVVGISNSLPYIIGIGDMEA